MADLRHKKPWTSGGLSQQEQKKAQRKEKRWGGLEEMMERDRTGVRLKSKARLTSPKALLRSKTGVVTLTKGR